MFCIYITASLTVSFDTLEALNIYMEAHHD